MICHRKDLVIDEVKLIEPSPADHHDEIVWARLTVKGASPVYIGSYYRSCTNYKTNGGGSNHKADSISGLQSSLDSLSTTHIRNNTHATIMLGGDFNVADIDWESNTSIHGSPMQALADNLLSKMDDHDLVNLQHEAIRCDNVLDLFCINKPGLVKSVSTMPGFSDHSFILVDTVLKPVTTKKKPRKLGIRQTGRVSNSLPEHSPTRPSSLNPLSRKPTRHSCNMYKES